MPLLAHIKKHVIIEESDVTIISDSIRYIDVALNCLMREREKIKDVIKENPEFGTSFSPYTSKDTSEVILRMQNAAKLANVGPMAAIAGVLADLMTEQMINSGAKIAVVENGGEIAINSIDDIFIGLYSHTTEVKNKIGFLYKGKSKALGIGTSSGMFGHAKSLGKADTVTIFAEKAGIADAVATRIANVITRDGKECNVINAIKLTETMDFIQGSFITCGDIVVKVGVIPELLFSI